MSRHVQEVAKLQTRYRTAAEEAGFDEKRIERNVKAMVRLPSGWTWSAWLRQLELEVAKVESRAVRKRAMSNQKRCC